MHVITSLSTGGAEVSLLRLLSKIRATEFECRVVSLTGIDTIGARLLESGVPVIALGGSARLLTLATRRQLRAFAAEWRPHVIHSWMYHANVYAHWLRWSLAWKDRPAHVGSVRGAMNAPRLQKATTRAIRRCDALLSGWTGAMVFNSAASAEQHMAIGYCRERTVVIPNGFDTGHFMPREHGRESKRASLGLRKDDIAIVMAARNHPLKGHAQLIDAFGRIASGNPRMRLILAGRGCGTDCRSLGDAMSAAGINEKVLLLGEVSDMPELYSACDIAVCASLSESFPNAIGEAMACGLPCIVPNVGDCGVLVGDTGVVVAAGHVRDLAGALLSMVSRPAHERRALGARARARICTTFELGAIAGRYEDLYMRTAGTTGLCRNRAIDG